MIQLTENLAVIADDLQYIVGKPVQRERNGTTVTEIRRPRYYPTLAGAVRGAVSQAMRDKVASEEITPLREFLAESGRMQAEFENMLKPLDV